MKQHVKQDGLKRILDGDVERRATKMLLQVLRDTRLDQVGLSNNGSIILLKGSTSDGKKSKFRLCWFFSCSAREKSGHSLAGTSGSSQQRSPGIKCGPS